MNYKPMTDEEIESANLIPEGTKCKAEVREAYDHIGKESGKESIKLVLDVYNGADEIPREVWCFITPNYAKLWKHAIVAMIGQQEYEAGHIGAESFVGKTCSVLVGQDEYQGKRKNIILDFIRGTDAAEVLPF